MTDEPDWSILLRTLYEDERSRFNRNVETGGSLPRDHILAGETGLGYERTNEAVQYLRDAGLLETTAKGKRFKITKKGFEVAHERRMQNRRDRREDQRIRQQEESEDQRAKRQHEVNLAVATLTLGLMLVTVLGSAVRVFVERNEDELALYTVGVGMVTVVRFGLVFYRLGLFSRFQGEA